MAGGRGSQRDYLGGNGWDKTELASAGMPGAEEWVALKFRELRVD
jgi:hypothetical protein